MQLGQKIHLEVRKQNAHIGTGARNDLLSPRLAGDQGQVRNRGRHQGLKQRLAVPEVARFAHPQLNHPGQAVLARLAHALVFLESRARLQGPLLLQQPFLGMQAHRSALARPGPGALRPQLASVTQRPVKLESPAFFVLSTARFCPADTHEPAGHISGGTGAGYRLQVDVKILFRLPLHAGSHQRSCLRLAVRRINVRRGLSPPSYRPCRAYMIEALG